MTQPQSMTGYGRGTAGNFKVEIRSSNHKSIDIHANIPGYLYSCEPEIKKRIRNRFHRGRIDLVIPKQEMDTFKLKVNKSLAREYYNALVTLKGELKLSDSIGIDMVAMQRDIFVLDEADIDTQGLYDALDSAMDELSRSREGEGRSLIHDIEKRTGLINTYLQDIEEQRAAFTSAAGEKLRDRLAEFLGDIEIDESRLIQECALLIEKTDITEEIVRLKSHVANFFQVLTSGDTIGKKLDFIVQELRREINTIGSKAQQYEIAGTVVEVKHELEKIREQVQNLQ